MDSVDISIVFAVKLELEKRPTTLIFLSLIFLGLHCISSPRNLEQGSSKALWECNSEREQVKGAVYFLILSSSSVTEVGGEREELFIFHSRLDQSNLRLKRYIFIRSSPSLFIMSFDSEIWDWFLARVAYLPTVR